MGFEPMTPGSAATVSEKIKIMTPLSWHFGPIEQAASAKGVLRAMHPRGASATAREQIRRAPRARPQRLPGLLRQAGSIRVPDSDRLRDLVSQARDGSSGDRGRSEDRAAGAGRIDCRPAP